MSISSDIIAKRVWTAVTEVRDGDLPVQRDLTAGECQELLKISQKNHTGEILPDGDVKLNLCSNAFSFGYWLGWKHAQAEYEDVILALIPETEYEPFPSMQPNLCQEEKASNHDAIQGAAPILATVTPEP